MDFGIFMGPTDESMSISALAPIVEEMGFESLWVPQHSHIPVAHDTEWGGGNALPRGHMAGLDPFIALGAAATVTTNLKLGTGACIVPAYDAIHLAKQTSTVDFMSRGRLLFGVAVGWNTQEIANHRSDPAHRWAITRDRLAAVKEIWANDEATYHGAHENFDPIWQWPKPIQSPHPPILVGGSGPAALRHAAAYGDEWMPFVGFGDFDVAAKMDELNTLAAEQGRGPIPTTVFGLPVEDGAADAYVAPGVTRLVFRLPPAAAEVVLPLLAHAKVIADNFAAAA
jgi:probable F420-dependent oxidoreductase